jgi:hypothetical protein
LTDPQKKEIYDRYGEEGLSGDGGAGGMSAEDLFSHLFGGGFGGGRGQPRGPRKGKDMVRNWIIVYDILGPWTQSIPSRSLQGQNVQVGSSETSLVFIMSRKR